MKSTDKFLIGIVAGILLLAVAAVAVALLRPKPDYLPEGSPEATVHNYLFALRQGDYARAYGYLSPALKGYPPSVVEFERNIASGYLDAASDSVTFEVVKARGTGDQRTVTVQKVSFYGGGLFQSGEYTQTFEMTTSNEGGQWKIVRADQYWLYCWTEAKGCD